MGRPLGLHLRRGPVVAQDRARRQHRHCQRRGLAGAAARRQRPGRGQRRGDPQPPAPRAQLRSRLGTLALYDGRFSPPRTFAWLEPEDCAYDSSRVVVLPVPYDSTTSGKPGTRSGPDAIIDASAEMELFDVEVGLEPYRVGIHTLPSIAPHTGDPGEMVRRVESVAGELIDDGKFVVTLGGEHTIAAGPARAHAARKPGLSVLAIDAHADMRDEYLDSPWNHACVLRRISEVAPVTQVGLRSACREEYEHILAAGFHYYTPGGYRSEGGAETVIQHLADDVYITIDIDGLDPAEMAAVGTPEPGGLWFGELSELLKAVCRERNVVGFDVTELAPDEGPFSCAQLAAKLVYRLIGFATAPR
ncbi:MAG: agmatinase [Dehalococcoidia bacterium]|nr:agmatinase [Dehalococcoidia bacterium]